MVGAVLGTAGATYADTLADCIGHPVHAALLVPLGGEASRDLATEVAADVVADSPRLSSAEMACEQRLGAASVQATPIKPGAPLISTAVRHVPKPGEPSSPGVLHPATDKAMALLIGWIMLALIAGGLCAGRPARRPVSDRHPAVRARRAAARRHPAGSRRAGSPNARQNPRCSPNRTPQHRAPTVPRIPMQRVGPPRTATRGR
ncbi:hypothetical protein [Pseudonocardia spinosispora]|uniref:hypothetical protein n=1 Tax=Pseudonocardia spinosispora TaxID=103441 RepID=UPI00041F8A0E|nr:hypothetical protein [Pseudonocardia spinosispora]